MVATVFLVPSLTYLLRINHQKKILDLSFRSGFWLGITIIFENSFALLVFFYLFSLFVSRNSSFREWLVLLIGTLIPLVFYFSYFLISDVPILNDPLNFGVVDTQEFWQTLGGLKKSFLIYTLLILVVCNLAFQKNLSKSVHYDKVSKKTFFVIGVGILAMGILNNFDNINDYFGVLILVLATTVPSFFILFRKEKVGSFIINLYVYAIVFLVVADYFY